MVDRVADIFALIVIGAISVRIVTNKNSARTIATVFHGFAEDVTAATGSRG